MHFTEPVYRNPYWPTFPLLQVTQGCTHNKCKFCTIYSSQRGEFTPLTEKEMMEELKTFVENLDIDAYFMTHHTSSMNLSGPNFLSRKKQILDDLQYGIDNFDMNELSSFRTNKKTL